MLGQVLEAMVAIAIRAKRTVFAPGDDLLIGDNFLICIAIAGICEIVCIAGHLFST